MQLSCVKWYHPGAVLALTEQLGTAFSTPYCFLHQGTNPAAVWKRGKRTGQWSFGNSKCQSLWSKGLEIKLAVTSDQDTEITEVSALLIHSGKQIEEQRLENILHEQGRGTLPPLPLLAQTVSLDGSEKNPKPVWETYVKHFCTCLFLGFPLVLNQGSSQTRGNETMTKNFITVSPRCGTSAALSRHSLLQFYHHH